MNNGSIATHIYNHDSNDSATPNNAVSSKVGRPRGESGNREKLITAARTLFVERDYSQVTIRNIPTLAGTDAGLIRYYFGSKEKLFTAMLTETSAPVKLQLQKINKQTDADAPASLMQTYYQVMSAHPNFPKLMLRLAGLDQSVPENKDIVRVFNDMVNDDDLMMFDKLKAKGLLRDDVDSQCAQLSFFAMMTFPFQAPDGLLQKFGIAITPEFLAKLAEQNAMLLARGLLKTNPYN